MLLSYDIDLFFLSKAGISFPHKGTAMTTPQRITWTGFSGIAYTYSIYRLEGIWNDFPGNYIFARQNAQGFWEAIYIGETSSLRDRLNGNHEKLPCARMHHFSHVHARVNQAGGADRRVEEDDLIASYNPPCNRQGT